MGDYNPRYKSIATDFIVKGKNKETGINEQELIIDASMHNEWYV